MCQETQRGGPGEMKKKKEYKVTTEISIRRKKKNAKKFLENSRTFTPADDKMSIHSTKTASDNMMTLLLPRVLASNAIRM